jgi:hypothetical protein
MKRPPFCVRRGAAAAAALAAVALTLASCSSGSGAPAGSAGIPPDTNLKEAGATVLGHIANYRQTAQRCATEPDPVVCVEAADRTLGDQVHTYANLLAVGHGFSAPAAELSTVRNAGQTVANSLEILGDAQPTEANYNHVLNTFDLNGALDQLQHAVTTLNAHLGG